MFTEKKKPEVKSKTVYYFIYTFAIRGEQRANELRSPDFLEKNNAEIRMNQVYANFQEAISMNKPTAVDEGVWVSGKDLTWFFVSGVSEKIISEDKICS